MKPLSDHPKTKKGATPGLLLFLFEKNRFNPLFLFSFLPCKQPLVPLLCER
jgi:hypothetical protein